MDVCFFFKVLLHVTQYFYHKGKIYFLEEFGIYLFLYFLSFINLAFGIYPEILKQKENRENQILGLKKNIKLAA